MSKQNSNVDSTGSMALAQFPPPISLDSPLLSSLISLPFKPLIAYAEFTPAASVNTSLHLSVIESARRSLVSTNGHLSVLYSLLPSVHITHQSSTLYVFAISSVEAISTSHSNLNSLSFDGLIVSGPDSFTPHDLYPCSLPCSTQRNPCPTCLNPQSPLSIPSSPQASSSSPQSSSSVECLLPRRPLRDAYSQFLCSVRDHVVHQMSEPRNKSCFESVVRYCDGFLLNPTQNISEWGVGWDHHAQSRSLIHCQVDVHLSPSRLTIHPILRPTHFLPLQASLPASPGTPIKLVPYGAPAFFLATYAGPTSALTAQFDASLSGLGVGDWKLDNKSVFSVSSAAKDPTYVIAWISIQNKQGEDKGITIIWPASLCLCFLPSSPQARQVLSYIPELPAQLQPSPPPPLPPSATLTNISSASPGETNPLLPSLQPPSRSFMTQARTSPTSDSLRSFRNLTLSKSKNAHEITHEISGYVDSVAKEREKERERIRKERDLAQSPPKPIITSRSNISVPGSLNSEVALPGSSQDQSAGLDDLTDVVTPAIPNAEVTTVELPLLQTQGAPSLEHDPATAAVVHRSSTVSVVIQPPAVSYDLFTTFDTSWSRPAPEFTAMDMDYDMGFGININSMGERGGGSRERFNMDLDDGFGAFTDDDFSFFDRPAAHTRSVMGREPPSPEIHPMGIDTRLTPTARLGSLGLPSPLFDEGTHGSGPGPPSATPGQSHPSPWTSGGLGEAFTPKFGNSNGLVESTPCASDLVPSSPKNKTPSSHSAPATPAVHFPHDTPDSFIINRQSSFVWGPTVFEPIAFASSHRVADDKYAFGKFAFPSPPDEEDRTESFSVFYPKMNGWKTKYNAITDPRISVVRKLIGAKRKSLDQGGREGRMSPSWVREQEEWQKGIVRLSEDEKSEVESDDDDDIFEDDDVVLGAGSDRPSTPLPPYLPLGPSLLATQFHHSHLLPISTPLRPPGASMAATNLGGTGPLISVPTPVSPPAILGDKSRSLETAANMLAKEMVENSVWAESWRLTLLDSSFAAKPSTEVCQADVKRTVRLFDGLDGLKGPLEMGSLFDLESASMSTCTSGAAASLQPMEPPLLSIGKSDVGIEILPPALRFWEKLGLTPRGGTKNVTAYVFFEEQEDNKLDCVSRWLNRVSVAYSARNFGTHAPGTSSNCSRDGVVPVHFDSFRKTLPSFVTDLPPSPGYLVFYIAAPASITTLASLVLRQVFSAAKRTLKACSESQILFQFVPESMVLSPLNGDPAGHRLGALVSSVYDRILTPVDRSMSHRVSEYGARIRKFFQDPSFSLGRPCLKKVSYVRQTPVCSLDVMDRHTLLHVGYRVSSCGKWLLAGCIDQRGENHELGVWLTQQEEGSAESFLVGQLWNFAVCVAKGASVEWRIVFSKSGKMGKREMDAWITILGDAIPACEEIRMMQVTLVSVELDSPWTFIAPVVKIPPPVAPTQPKNPAGIRFEDVSATTYALLPPVPMALSPVPLRSRDVWTNTHFVEDHDDAPTCDMSVRALSTATIIRVPADTDYTSISMLRVHLLHSVKSPLSSLNTMDEETHLDIIHNFHELAVLAKARWRLDKTVNPILPFHLAALEVMDEALAGELLWD